MEVTTKNNHIAAFARRYYDRANSIKYEISFASAAFKAARYFFLVSVAGDKFDAPQLKGSRPNSLEMSRSARSLLCLPLPLGKQ
jgi:hypothetical protein